jgi:nucleotide-binding universal stress UspA family protein
MTLHPIVVGYDDSPASRLALTWALPTAHGRGADILLVHAAKTFPPMMSKRWNSIVSPQEITTEAGKAVLQAGVLLAKKIAPEVTVTSTLIEDAPAAALRGVGDDAAMIVVGTRGRGGFAELVVGSTSLDVATHAPCPVVVVRPDTAEAIEPGPEAGRVVVGVDGPDASTDAVEFAFEQAGARDTGLTVLHAWQVPFFDLPGKGVPIPTDLQVEQFQADQRRWLSEHLAGWQNKYPDVSVKMDVVPGHPAAVLAAASAGAELLVLGWHGHGGPRAVMTLGCVAHAVLHHAHCAVAVVRHS